MPEVRVRCSCLAPLALAAAVIAAAAGCAESPRDRHYRARAVVHHPTPLAPEPAPTARPIVTVPLGLD